MVSSKDVLGSDWIVQKLGRAITRGMALASVTAVTACGDHMPVGGDPGPGIPDAGSDAAGPLVPYPLSGLGCFGLCCVAARCTTPADGGSCSPARLGSSCSCMASGPYAPNPLHVPVTPGTCCYLEGVVIAGCEGRPLIVEGAPLIAEVVTRTDWAPFA